MSRVDRIDGLTGSIGVKAPVKVATTANITLSGAQTIDGIALTADETPRQRVLVKNQTDDTENGIYDVNSGAWTRSPDFDGDRDAVNGTMVLVAEGTPPFGKAYYLSATNPVNIGTDSLSFVLVPQFGYEVVDDLSPQLGGALDPNGFSIGLEKGGDIASASPLVIDTDGDYFDVTGTTNFAAMTVSANRHFFLQFDGILTMTHHATNLDLPGEANITTAAGDVAEFFSTGSNTVQCTNYVRADGSPVVILDEDDMASDSATLPASQQSVKSYIDNSIDALPILTNYIGGLILSNDTDTDHDIAISVGTASDSSNTQYLSLSSSMVKRIDGTWSSGTGNGGLFNGSVAADTWYYVFIIMKDSDSSIDAGFDISETAANIPSGYTKYRRIGAILTDGSANIIEFIQQDDYFYWKASVLDVDVTNQSTSVVSYTLSIPPIEIKALLTGALYHSTAASSVYIQDPDKTDISIVALAAAGLVGAVAASGTSTNKTGGSNDVIIRTDSGQVNCKATTTLTRFKIITNGWIDNRV